ncbi:hypothetical protein N7495_003135 [Penicillium taxi]|uniref:uncharacterized protein n=1 Tax=Penicillium taxi TaxID=168475 RepID=UPI0025455FC4|nr:uncharacterized protein N7495_003135 [Penicillium taxi]KAJ5902607.1 hypothetical protein N7495_003135 [Penicillium taxi]
MLSTHWLPAARVNLAKTRKFSLISTHTSFPATMYRFQLHRKATLYDAREEESRRTKDGIQVSDDGLVHAAISKSSPYSNGPVFMPNTRLMQQMLRFDYDRYLDDVADGKCVLDPVVVRIERGTSIPDSLALWREGASRFSLQPSSPIEVEKLNDLLSGLYETSATVLDAGEFVEKYPYRESIFDKDEQAWMKA